MPVFAILAVEGSLDSGRGFVLAVAVARESSSRACRRGSGRRDRPACARDTRSRRRAGRWVLVVLSALDLWVGGPRVGIGSLFVCAAAVLAAVTLAQSLLERYAGSKRRVLVVGRSGGAPALMKSWG